MERSGHPGQKHLKRMLLRCLSVFINICLCLLLLMFVFPLRKKLLMLFSVMETQMFYKVVGVTFVDFIFEKDTKVKKFQ